MRGVAPHRLFAAADKVVYNTRYLDTEIGERRLLVVAEVAEDPTTTGSRDDVVHLALGRDALRREDLLPI